MTTKKRPRPRTSPKTSPARLRAVERAGQALALRADGRTFHEIAERLGYRSRQAAHDAVQRALLLTLQEPAQTVRALDLERLDRLWLAHFKRAEQGRVSSAHVCIRILERRARLLGLDAPEKIDANVNAVHSGGVLVVPAAMAADAWAALAEQQQGELQAMEAKIIKREFSPPQH